jgi:hypothetical protein
VFAKSGFVGESAERPVHGYIHKFDQENCRKMSDDEVEKFEVTDYDLFNEFNMNRPRHRLSKNKQIYGKYSQTHASITKHAY